MRFSMLGIETKFEAMTKNSLRSNSVTVYRECDWTKD